MNEETPGPEKDPRSFLTNPCVLDVETPVGLVSLLMDVEHYQYLFVQIEGAWRKCIRLQGEDHRIGNEDEVWEFLNRFRNSDAFAELIAEEENINSGFDEL